MKQLQLLFRNEIVLEDERRMKLEYSITEKVSMTDQKTPCYGIKVTKYLDNVSESDEVAEISYSRDTVVSILKKLFQFEVTPISMVEIIDDLVTQAT